MVYKKHLLKKRVIHI